MSCPAYRRLTLPEYSRSCASTHARTRLTHPRAISGRLEIDTRLRDDCDWSLHAYPSCGRASKVRRTVGLWRSLYLTLATLLCDSLVHVNFFSHSNYTTSQHDCHSAVSWAASGLIAQPRHLTPYNRPWHIPELYYCPIYQTVYSLNYVRRTLVSLYKPTCYRYQGEARSECLLQSTSKEHGYTA